MSYDIDDLNLGYCSSVVGNLWDACIVFDLRFVCNSRKDWDCHGVVTFLHVRVKHAVDGECSLAVMTGGHQQPPSWTQQAC